MQRASETGYLNAMAAATYLSNKGVAFRKAHEIVGNAVRMGLDKSCELNALSLEELRTLSPEFSEDFFDFVTLRSTLDCHDVPGGTATRRVRDALTAAHTRISNLASRTSSFEEAKEKELV
jgi:argininosuccinate lyase